jgi:predicted lipid-binding transport protein (Tim44 family)
MEASPMKRLFAALFVAVLGFGLAIGNAEAAKRVGSGKTMGAQRDGVSQRQATPPAASPAAPSATPNAAAAGQRPGMSRWLAPLAGLAAGLGLAYLFGDQLGSLLMGALLVGAVIFAVVMLMRAMSRRNNPQPAAAGVGAGGRGDFNQQRSALNPVAGGAAAPAAASQAVPAGFDVAGFLGHAKQAFVALQAANDRGDLEAIREMTTDELFQSLKAEIDARGNVAQQVDVVRLDAALLEVVTEGAMHWASVRFSGSMREAADALPEQFSEIWNLRKPVDGSTGWTLAGIQQA